MGRELDLLVPPLRGAVHARDQGGPVDATEVAADEGVAGLGLVARALGEAEVPCGVLGPGVTLEVGVLRGGVRLLLAPVAVQDVLPVVDQALCMLDPRAVGRVLRHPPRLPRKICSTPRS